MTDDKQEALHMDLCDLCEKYSGEMGVPVFVHIVTSFITQLSMDSAPSEHTGISVMLQAIGATGLAYERKEENNTDNFLCDKCEDIINVDGGEPSHETEDGTGTYVCETCIGEEE